MQLIIIIIPTLSEKTYWEIFLYIIIIYIIKLVILHFISFKIVFWPKLIKLKFLQLFFASLRFRIVWPIKGGNSSSILEELSALRITLALRPKGPNHSKDFSSFAITWGAVTLGKRSTSYRAVREKAVAQSAWISNTWSLSRHKLLPKD
ncbi:unnamed protein product [Blepharisma stoltei]|uniref:Uncharacterized protein n=1 Tax=Blepharisma stoltei TaxID=1481888 RepID=A0AAU9K4D6_9CILI|nr:unnamed protein product [Blepharisma stoltei]